MPQVCFSPLHSISLELILPLKIKPAVADHRKSELPAQMDAAYAIAHQPDCEANVVLHRLTITGIIAAAAGPADTSPEITDVITIITMSNNFGFGMFASSINAILLKKPVSLITVARNKKEAIVNTDFISTDCFIRIPLSDATIKLVQYPRIAMISGGTMFCGRILHDMNINNIITPRGIRTSYRTFKFLYLLCNKSTASNLEFSEVSLFLIFSIQKDNRTIDVNRNNGNALNKYPVKDVIPLVIITIAGKSPMGELAPPVLLSASITAKKVDV